MSLTDRLALGGLALFILLVMAAMSAALFFPHLTLAVTLVKLAFLYVIGAVVGAILYLLYIAIRGKS